MGVCTFLVSDEHKEWFDLGKIFFEEEAVTRMRCLSAGLVAEMVVYIRDTSYNTACSHEQAVKMALFIAEWMYLHPDWRFLTDQDPKYNDIYLAEDAEDAKEYAEEFGEEDFPIYKKTGTIGEESDEAVFADESHKVPSIEDVQSFLKLIQDVPKGLPKGFVIPRPRLMDPVYLFFEITLDPGQCLDVRPYKATRIRALGDGKYAAAEEVSLDSVKPFRATKIRPDEPLGSWAPESGIYFSAAHFDGSVNSDLIGESLACIVAGGGPFSTSPSAREVWFTVRNRGVETVQIAWQVEGVTPGKER